MAQITAKGINTEINAPMIANPANSVFPNNISMPRPTKI